MLPGFISRWIKRRVLSSSRASTYNRLVNRGLGRVVGALDGAALADLPGRVAGLRAVLEVMAVEFVAAEGMVKVDCWEDRSGYRCMWVSADSSTLWRISERCAFLGLVLRRRCTVLDRPAVYTKDLDTQDLGEQIGANGGTAYAYVDD